MHKNTYFLAIFKPYPRPDDNRQILNTIFICLLLLLFYMEEYRKIVKIDPIILNQSDLEELEAFFKSNTSKDEKLEVELEASEGNKKCTFKSFIEFFNNEAFTNTKKLDLKIRIWDENKIIKGISIELNHYEPSYQIYSENEIWFLGIISKLDLFFKKRKPWNSFIIKKFHGFISTLSPTLGATLVLSFKKEMVIPIISSITAFVILSLIVFLRNKRYILVFTRLSKSPQKKKHNYQLLYLIISILTLLATIIIPFIKK